MKYYRTKERKTEDYTNNKYQPCWTCSNCYGGCSWSREFKPVDNWIATENIIIENGEHTKTYKIIYCPEYIKENR